jgi:hypothetical protein
MAERVFILTCVVLSGSLPFDFKQHNVEHDIDKEHLQTNDALLKSEWTTRHIALSSTRFALKIRVPSYFAEEHAL